MKQKTGIVVIGKNEAKQLRLSMKAISNLVYPTIYVDSGSTDNSVQIVRSFNIDVWDLDPSIPFSAARARNEGFDLLNERYPNQQYIQFIDGDCEIDESWIEVGTNFLEENHEYAIVYGRISEKHRDFSVYNMLCDIEWKKIFGDITTCGGIFLVRKESFKQVGKFDNSVVAGEEPELCFRLIHSGWKIRHLDIPMATHDADISSFEQWWKRMIRSGLAYAQGYALHGKGKKRFRFRECVRPWVYIIFLLIIIVIELNYSSHVILLLLLAIPLQMIRIAHIVRHKVKSYHEALIYAFFNIIGKPAEIIGQLRFIINHFYVEAIKS